MQQALGSNRARAHSACGPISQGLQHLAPTVKSRSHSATSETGSENFGSENSVVQETVRQVMSDLTSVLDELRTVVGDIKTLVTQIDIVTHKMDKAKGSQEGTQRRASSTGVERLAKPQELHDTRKSHSYNATPVGTTSKREVKTERISAVELSKMLEKRVVPDFRVDNLHLPTDANHNSKFVVVPGHRRLSDKSHSGSGVSGHNYVNVVITSEGTSLDTGYGSDKHNYVNVDGIGNNTVIDNTYHRNDRSSDELANDINNIPASDDSDPDVGKTVSSNKSSPYSTFTPMSMSSSSPSSTLTSNNSLENEYSGLYEREMEDSLELEITEYRDIFGQNDSRSSTGSSQESDDYVDWGRRELDASVKHAEVMAWTRSSWIGKQVYHVSLDHSLGYSESVTDGEGPDPEFDADNEQWTKLLPPNLNTQAVNFCWRTVVEP